VALTDLLRCEVPIQLAPMGGVSVSPALPVAVARAGAHAMYPGLMHTPETLAPLLDALEPPFGVNFIVPVMNREAAELACERAPYVDFFLAEPDADLVALVSGVCGWQVETAEEARAAEAAGCDVVIVKGLESGGRKRVEGPELRPLLEETLAAVSIPVIAAGGIATASGVAEAIDAGAAGVRVGTRFIASEESEAHPAWIAALIEATADDSVVSHAFNVGLPVPGPHRVLRRSLDAAAAVTDEFAGEINGIRLPPYAPMPPSRDATGTVEAMPFYAGRSAGAVTEVKPAAEIVAELWP
jgi:NAD(P)H-dependent flavin oxidoreductase YrpB (nitropropane dioxygenase family)